MSTTSLDPVTPPQEADVPDRTEDRFAEALRPGLMGPRLRAALGGGPSTCHVLDAKFEPGVRAVLVYEHAGRLVRGDLLTQVGQPADEETETAPTVAPGVRLHGFPHDPELPLLPGIMDAERLGPVLAEALLSPSAARTRGGAVRCRNTLLRYRPGKRVTLGVGFAGDAGRFVAKAYHDAAKAGAVAHEAPLLTPSQSAGGTLRFAPTVAHLPELQLVVQRAVRGTPLDGLLGAATRRRTDDARQALGAAARALAELHDAPSVTTRHRSVQRELLRFQARAARIGSVHPQLGAATGQLADRLLDLEAHLPEARNGIVHGDCKPSQFLLDGRRVYVMDLDHLGVSDQAADVGTFLASLRQTAARSALTRGHRGGSELVDELSRVFLRSYLAARGDDATRTRIQWQMAAALERKALRSFARAPRSPLAGALVEEAHRCLDALEEAP